MGSQGLRHLVYPLQLPRPARGSKLLLRENLRQDQAQPEGQGADAVHHARPELLDQVVILAGHLGGLGGLRHGKSYDSFQVAAQALTFFALQLSQEDFRPRAHSLEGISRAKIKSVKQTVVVIVGYVLCSTPAVAVHLWTAWVQGKSNLSKCRFNFHQRK